MLPLKVLALYRRVQKLLDRTLPEPLFYQRRYFILHGRFCNFREPKRFSEKIFHRMRYPAPIFSLLADKVRAREYIESTVGTQYLVPYYLVCDRVTLEIFESLPDSFVMKANHSSGQIKIIANKHKENLQELTHKANNWLEKDFSKLFREKHYAGIQPRVIFEKALLCNGKPPNDYKFHIFNCGPGSSPYVFIQVMQGRFEKLTQTLFFEDWSIAPFNYIENGSSQEPHIFTTPKELPEMLEIAKRLSAPFGYLRVDLYRHDGKIYVGELTVTPAAGAYRFLPPEWDLMLGSKFGWPEDLPPAWPIGKLCNLP